MFISSDFQFSQNNLQDFLDCPKRFQLRYLDNLAWPAQQSEPAIELEELMMMGNRFHQMGHQYFIGVEPATIEASVTDPILLFWWNNFIKEFPKPYPTKNLPEFMLQAPFHGFRLAAKYDLITIDADGNATIYDWKTNRKVPRQEWIIQRAQSIVYPLLLSLAGQSINQGNPIDPSQITMHYWFAGYPKDAISISYNAQRQNINIERLQQTIDQILEFCDTGFPLTNEIRSCLYCKYRSYCSRGDKAGKVEDEFDALDLSDSLDSFDLDQIKEIPW
jgi:hypothetical protein